MLPRTVGGAQPVSFVDLVRVLPEHLAVGGADHFALLTDEDVDRRPVARQQRGHGLVHLGLFPGGPAGLGVEAVHVGEIDGQLAADDRRGRGIEKLLARRAGGSTAAGRQGRSRPPHRCRSRSRRACRRWPACCVNPTISKCPCRCPSNFSVYFFLSNSDQGVVQRLAGRPALHGVLFRLELPGKRLDLLRKAGLASRSAWGVAS